MRRIKDVLINIRRASVDIIEYEKRMAIGSQTPNLMYFKLDCPQIDSRT